MKFIKCTLFLFVVWSCNSEENQKEALVEEFGEYIEDVKPGYENYYKLYDSTLTLWDTPFQEVHINTTFGKAHVIVTGDKDAEPLVLLHGMNASSTMWYPNIKALSEKYRVYAIDDLMEPGKSHNNTEIDEVPVLMNWYNQVFDSLKLEKFSLIGASKGGWHSINIALLNRERINKMILLSPAQSFIWIRPGEKMLSNITYSMNPKRKNLRDVLQTMTTNVDHIKQAYIDQYFVATDKASLNTFMLKMRPFADEELKSLDMPVLVLIGDTDIINKEKSVELADELLSNGETGIIKNAGHFLTIDQAEVVNKRMLKFLND